MTTIDGGDVMSGWYTNAFARGLDQAIAVFEQIRDMQRKYRLEDKVELWKIDEDKYGNRFVVITRTFGKRRESTVKLIEKVKP